LIQYFYEGLQPAERGIIDAASGGALVDKTPAAARKLIANMAENIHNSFILGIPLKEYMKLEHKY